MRWEDFATAFAAGERLLPFRAAPEGDGLVVVAVAESERAIEPGDRIVRIGTVPAAEHLARLRSLQPGESERANARTDVMPFPSPAKPWHGVVLLTDTKPTEMEVRPVEADPQDDVKIGPGCCRIGRESAARASGGSPESTSGHSKLWAENRVP